MAAGWRQVHVFNIKRHHICGWLQQGLGLALMPIRCLPLRLAPRLLLCSRLRCVMLGSSGARLWMQGPDPVVVWQR